MPVICVWNKCNSRCLMCSNPSEFQARDSHKDYSFDALKARINKTNIIDDKIILTGGEPTIHPEFFKVISYIRKKFPRMIIELDTNARRFCYPEFTRKLLSFNKINILTVLHGFNAETHDAVTRTPGSFDQAVKGIKNVFEYKDIGLHDIELRIVITKITYKYAEKILAFAKKEFPEFDRVVVIFMEMEGQAKKNFKVVGLNYTQFKDYIPKIAKWIPKFKELRFYHFPLCIIDYSLWKYTWRTLPDYEVTFLPECENCLYKKYCLGIHKDYIEKIGVREFKPIKKEYIIKENNDPYHPIKDVFNK